MSQDPIDGALPHEIEKWLHTAVDADTGRTNLLAYVLARLVGLDPIQSVASALLFQMDAERTWARDENPTRGELFATAERTILQPPASAPRTGASARRFGNEREPTTMQDRLRDFSQRNVVATEHAT